MLFHKIICIIHLVSPCTGTAEGNEYHGLCKDCTLPDGICTRTGENHIRSGNHIAHFPVDKSIRMIAFVLNPGHGLICPSRLMNNSKMLTEPVQVFLHQLIYLMSAKASPHHKQERFGKPVSAKKKVFSPFCIRLIKDRTHRISRHKCLIAFCDGKIVFSRLVRKKNLCGKAAVDFCSKPGRKITFMCINRNTQNFCRNTGGNGNKTALGKKNDRLYFHKTEKGNKDPCPYFKQINKVF